MEGEDNCVRAALIPSRQPIVVGMDMAEMEMGGEDDHVREADHDGEHDHDQEVYHMESKTKALPVVANPQIPLHSQLLRPISSFSHPLHQLDIY